LPSRQNRERRAEKVDRRVKKSALLGLLTILHSLLSIGADTQSRVP
jgi:hypothetical protein